jgi:ditrans,polycis-polyprenyl diphosphate synthase
VTIYAFSIENFKRSKHEVDALMSMAKVKLEQLAEHGALLDRYGASIRVLGQRELMKKDVLAAVDKAVAITAHNKRYAPHGYRKTLLTLRRAVLNVCFPYTSRDEITTAVMKTVETYSTPIHNLSTPSKRTFSTSPNIFASRCWERMWREEPSSWNRGQHRLYPKTRIIRQRTSLPRLPRL